MKAVLRSVKPYWFYLMCEGINKVDITTKEPISKDWNGTVYLYCSKDKKSFERIPEEYREKYKKYLGTVGAKFVCDKVDKFSCKCIPRQGIAFGYERFIKDGVYLLNNNDTDYVVFERQDKYLDTMLKNADLAAMCLTPRELFQYAGGFSKPLYAWHISDLKIYDTPRALCEFVAPCKRHKTKPDESCKGCPYIFKGMTSGKLTCDRALRHAPRTMQYVLDIVG